MSRRFGQFFGDVWKSATDFRFYQQVACLPFGVAFRHLLKIAVGVGTFIAIFMVVEVVSLNPVWIWFRDNMPEITIHEGEAGVDVEQPHVIERVDKKGEKFAVVIDTTGKTRTIDPNYKNALLVKKRGFVLKVGTREFTQRFPDDRDITIDRNYFDKLVVSYRSLALYIAMAYGGTLLFFFVQSAAVAFIGQAVSVVLSRGGGYLATLQMSFYALSLAVCFLLLVVLLGLRLPLLYFLGVYIFIHVAFLIGAVLTSGKDKVAA